MYNIIPFLIIIASLSIILFIIIRKFPTLSSVDTEASPKEKQSRLHEKIVVGRIKRRFAGWLNIKKISLVSKWFIGLKNSLKTFHERLIDLEKKNRFIGFKKRKKALGDDREIGVLREAENLFKENKPEEAEKKFIEVIKLNAHNMDAYRGLGEIYLELKQYNQAKEVFEYIIKFDERDSDAYFKLGTVKQGEGDTSTAREYYLKANKLSPGSIKTLAGLIDTCRSLNFNEEALGYLKEAINIEPNNPRYLDQLIDIGIILKDKELAIENLDKLKEVNPENKKIEEYKKVIKEL